jgi:hypothetical protein
MVVQLGVLNLDVVNFGRRAVFFFDQAADFAAGLGPGFDVGRVASQKGGLSAHGNFSPRSVVDRGQNARSRRV